MTKSTPKNWISILCWNHLDHLANEVLCDVPAAGAPEMDLQPADKEIAEANVLADDSQENRLEASVFTHKDVNRQFKVLYTDG